MDSKICKRCFIEKELSRFEYIKSSGGYRSICKDCRNEQHRKEYILKKEKKSEKCKLYYQKHKEEIIKKRKIQYNYDSEFKEKHLDYYQKHKEEISNKRKMKYETNPEFKKRYLDYYQKHKEEISEKRKIRYYSDLEFRKKMLDSSRIYYENKKNVFNENLNKNK